jgi:hypothetical protein
MIEEQPLPGPNIQHQGILGKLITKQGIKDGAFTLKPPAFDLVVQDPFGFQVIPLFHCAVSPEKALSFYDACGAKSRIFSTRVTACAFGTAFFPQLFLAPGLGSFPKDVEVSVVYGHYGRNMGGARSCLICSPKETGRSCIRDYSSTKRRRLEKSVPPGFRSTANKLTPSG